MRTIFVIAVCLLLVACDHNPPPLPPLPGPVRIVPPPARPAIKPPALPAPAQPAPTPLARPQMPDDRTPDHVCTDLAKRRAEDAALLGDDGKQQNAVRKKVYADCIGSTKNSVR